ncbi:MAG: hypothetical protein CMM48_00440 [Rhodospirillaceae bacterium]|nr:hypothetical protein [Rhodospirillaceae bacterium]HAA93330.1 hypothetical protein [Rhodospirillaceae bacterium]
MTSYDRLQALSEKQLFFIVGASKSGTTWLQLLLDGHPAICSRGEGHFIDNLMPFLSQALLTYNQKSLERNDAAKAIGWEANCPIFDGDDFAFLVRTAVLRAFDRWIDDDSVTCIGDKTPEHAIGMDELSDLFPTSRFIHILRDGRDVCLSGWLFAQNRDADAVKNMTMVEYVSAYADAWCNRVTSARAFGAAHPDRFHEIRYETLHGDLDVEVARVLDFLGVDNGAEMVAACRQAGAFETSSGGRERGEEDKTSFFRKGVIGDHRNHFDEETYAAVEKAAGPLLRELGYDRA